MNKLQLVNEISKTANISKTFANNVLNAVVSSIIKSLQKGDNVTLIGFGTFTVKNRLPRKGRNPKTGAEIIISATKIPIFKAGKILKNALSNNNIK